MKINLGCINYESWKPNDFYLVAQQSNEWEILIDFNPVKDGWLLEENGN